MISSVCERAQSGIKAIETVYNGYRFRSRLEARWAVFFDAAGIEYEYEPEGFELDDGTKYLPDFYFPQYDWYGEVKPPRDGAELEIKRAARFVGSQIKALLLFGCLPPKSDIDMWHYKALYYHPLQREVKYGGFCILPQWEDDGINGLGFEAWLGVDYRVVGDTCMISKHFIRDILTPIHNRDLSSQFLIDHGYSYADAMKDDKDYVQALSLPYDKARQARFEHGECG